MKHYENYLIKIGYNVRYIESKDKSSEIKNFIRNLSKEIETIHTIDPDDYLIEKRLKKRVSKKKYKNYFL